MNQYINIDSENYHYLCMFNVTDQFHVVCRSGMTSIDFDVINVDNYDINKLKECYQYCDYLSEKNTQNHNELFDKLGYCGHQFVSWLLHVKQNLIDDKYHQLNKDEIKIITLVFITGTNIVKSALDNYNCEQ